ncbi:MAG TPA: 3D domain-containing protein [Pyrinomonadaceae bacterium]|nr:3D domain-containing protein [Pyrinomonadaceae bacterium]
MKSLFRGSAVVAVSLLSSSFLLSAIPSVAETPALTWQQRQALTQNQKSEANVADDKNAKSANTTGVVTEATDPAGGVGTDTTSTKVGVTQPINYTATAYSLTGRTASGRHVSKGLIAADPRVLPLGTRVHLHAGPYTGEYLVADTGGSIRGKRIDIWTPSGREAMRFGRRTVKLTVLSYGPKRGHAKR